HNKTSKSRRESLSTKSQGVEGGEVKSPEHEHADEEGKDHAQHEDGTLLTELASNVADTASNIMENITNVFKVTNEEKNEDDKKEDSNNAEQDTVDVKEDVEEHGEETSDYRIGYTFIETDLTVPSKDFERNEEKNEQTGNEDTMKRPESVGFMPQPVAQINTDVNDTFVISGPATPLDKTQKCQRQGIMTTSYIDGNNAQKSI
ncbi:unnamed protein product, partial [Didymodactylos carnosus]